MKRRGHRGCVVLAAVLAVGALAACGSSSVNDSARSAPSSPTSCEQPVDLRGPSGTSAPLPVGQVGILPDRPVASAVQCVYEFPSPDRSTWRLVERRDETVALGRWIDQTYGRVPWEPIAEVGTDEGTAVSILDVEFVDGTRKRVVSWGGDLDLPPWRATRQPTDAASTLKVQFDGSVVCSRLSAGEPAKTTCRAAPSGLAL